MHRHKIHNHPANFKTQVPNKVRISIDKLEEIVVGCPTAVGVKKIYYTQPEIFWNNYFSHTVIFDCEGKNGLGLIMTVRRDRLPKGVPSKYIHKDGTDIKAHSKAESYLKPIVMVKKEKEFEVGHKYEHVHTTFQSTSSCNIQVVNMMNQCSYYNTMKERGAGDNKRVWNIKMNESRAMYLGMYYKVDCIDHLIQNSRMSYRSFRYCHSPMLHAKALAVVTAL